ncbi:MAG: HD domain-containing protein [Patescibacteria group bacterium]
MRKVEELKKELRKKLYSYVLEKKEITEIFQAVSYADKMHAGQFRVGGEAYICHPLRVAIATAEYFAKESLKELKVAVISALLHDVVEDTEATFEEVDALFGNYVTKIVKATSHSLNSDGLVNEDEPDEVYLLQVEQGGLIAIVIKRFDMKDNLNSLKEVPEDFYISHLNDYKKKLKIWKEIDIEGWAEVHVVFLKTQQDGCKKNN